VQRSLVKAIEARMVSGPGAAARRQTMIDDALAEGFILTPYFAEALVLYEKQETALRLYFPEMIDGINLRKEDKRLENVQFAAAPVSRKPKATCSEDLTPVLTGADKTIDDAEKLLNARPRRTEEARKLLLAVLQDTDNPAVHTKAYYGLARIAVLEKDPELAERLFRKTLEMNPDAFVKAWSLVYLGNLYDLAGQSPEAAEQYKAALAVEGGSEKAREQAQKGLSGAFQRKAQ
jgi:tetratricopeptide (TPR) repeat protein